MPNTSPWITQLKRKLPSHTLKENKKTHIAIVGGGIAGIASAYYILKHTDRDVLLLEGDKIAHGATGHNAGQVVSYFERQLSGLVKEYGLELAADAQKAVNSAWNLLEQIFVNTNIKTPFAQFTGYAGCQDLDEILVHLENNWYSREVAINMEPLVISEEFLDKKRIPEKYNGLYSLVPHIDVLSLLQTKDSRYIAALSARKGCMNSALFCEEILEYLVEHYKKRFEFFEHSHVKEVCLDNGFAQLKVGEFEVVADRVVLCTNGFEKFKITNRVGKDINTKFHHLVNGAVGYMAAYLEEHTMPPVAISYLPKTNTASSAMENDPYFYLTRRTFELEENQKDSLICIGGPEVLMEDTNKYSKEEHSYPEEAQKVIDEFLHQTYMFAPKGEIKYQYKWHGLMGYTPNGLRCIGPEPLNPVLLYNLGCNGVGILPSIYGGRKIAQFINGENIKRSIFDPQTEYPDESALTLPSSTSKTVSQRSFSLRSIWNRIFN